MIYYVEDDENIRDLALYALKKASLPAKGFPDASSFFEACDDELPDCILLDIMLPGMNGLEILEALRNDQRTSAIPVMMLTAKGTEFDKVLGLDGGADDYLVKPFGMMEFVSRVNALLRRSGMRNPREEHRMLTLGQVIMDLDTRSVTVSGKPCILTMKEFDLLAMLAENAECVLSREQIMREVWDTDFLGNTRTVDVHILSLRQKIEAVDPHARSYIRTVRGIGYKASSHE